MEVIWIRRLELSLVRLLLRYIPNPSKNPYSSLIVRIEEWPSRYNPRSRFDNTYRLLRIYTLLLRICIASILESRLGASPLVSYLPLYTNIL
jgi:hypothetical protein